ncbi:cyclic AMP-dependent transcription factor ATF-2-like isoform X2 [Leptotrombidium deliense]|uniref:Cyclic AMP-dependent transcription factor ATF-2-like isoform X2 n=1 Tax=Leptotrombidium deliense TaxID=299467 RepID=A0A443SVJ7_9ACAR|nr:cyclic AMP-dependent transcription factor ATF-2-like isoform X2 [Leptotrombidium deliense]
MMNVDDKPFACTFKGCGMKFVTEDHLSVHKSLHEKRLNLSLNLPQRFGDQLVDQTPTPTRFLGNFLKLTEETGLYTSELRELIEPKSSTCNPFEETFRNASSSPNALKLSVSQNVFSEDSLNTPSVEVVSTPLPKFPIIQKPAVEQEELSDKELRVELNAEDDIEIVETSTGSPILESNLCVNATSLPIPVTCSSSSSAESTSTLTNTTNSAVIDNSAMSIEKRSKLIKKVIPYVQSTNSSSLPVVSKPLLLLPKSQVLPAIVTQAPIYQVVVCKLNNGNSVQVLPTVPQVVDKSTVAILKPKEQTGSEKVTQPLMTISPKPVNNGVIRLSTTSCQSTALSQISPQSSSSQTSLDTMPTVQRAKPGRRSKTAPVEDPTQRKVRALERNRAAAMRCRRKKKVWIDTLETNAAELEASREKLQVLLTYIQVMFSNVYLLQAEVDKLRKEVTQLKTALLEHKDCPVTLKQLKVAGREIGKVIT